MTARGFKMLPPPPGVCEECAVDHAPNEPHKPSSLFYQYKFHAKHGRWPTWVDAMAHLDEDVQKFIKEELILQGVWNPEWEDPDRRVPEVMPAEDGSIGTLKVVPIKEKKSPKEDS